MTLQQLTQLLAILEAAGGSQDGDVSFFNRIFCIDNIFLIEYSKIFIFFNMDRLI